MSNTDTTTLDADRAEFADLMSAAARGGLVASTSQRLEVLRARLDAAEEAERVELADLRHQADRGLLAPDTWRRLRELNRREAEAEGDKAGADLTAAADVLRERGHR